MAVSAHKSGFSDQATAFWPWARGAGLTIRGQGAIEVPTFAIYIYIQVIKINEASEQAPCPLLPSNSVTWGIFVAK